MVNTEIRLIIFFAAEDGEALYSHQKQDRELTVAQIMNSLLPNSDLNWRNPWSNRQIWPWIQNETGQRLREFFQENSLVIANTLFQQHKRRLYAGTSLDGQHWNQIDYILCSQRWRSSIQSTKTRPGTDCGSDHELLIAKFRLNLKKVGKTTRPFRSSPLNLFLTSTV